MKQAVKEVRTVEEFVKVLEEQKPGEMLRIMVVIDEEERDGEEGRI